METKAIHGNTLNFKSDIRKSQWEGLTKIADKNVDGVNAGIICWFIDKDLTVYLDIKYLQQLNNLGYKSFNAVKDTPTTIIDAAKKRVFFDYNLKKFLNEIGE